MTRDLGRLRAAMATLLVASALLFLVGIFIERGGGSAATPHVEASPPAAASTTPHVEGSGETGGEAGESHARGATAETAGESAAHSESGGSEAILGIDPEAPALVALAIIVSLLAAFLVWRDGRRLVIAAALVVALGFAALDLLEVSHQAREGTALLVIVAGLVAVGHLLAAGLGVVIYRRPETE